MRIEIEKINVLVPERATRLVRRGFSCGTTFGLSGSPVSAMHAFPEKVFPLKL
jgi:molybdopterin biosynthesis enzyme